MGQKVIDLLAVDHCVIIQTDIGKVIVSSCEFCSGKISKYLFCSAWLSLQSTTS